MATIYSDYCVDFQYIANTAELEDNSTANRRPNLHLWSVSAKQQNKHDFFATFVIPKFCTATKFTEYYLLKMNSTNQYL